MFKSKKNTTFNLKDYIPGYQTYAFISDKFDSAKEYIKINRNFDELEIELSKASLNISLDDAHYLVAKLAKAIEDIERYKEQQKEMLHGYRE